MTRPEAVVFDFDGVIVESVEIKNRAYETLFRHESAHVDEIVAFHLAHIGLSRYEKFPRIYTEILGRPLDAEEADRLDREFSRLVAEELLQCPLVKGAREFLERHSRTQRLYVASAAPEGEVRGVVAARGLVSFFQAVYGSPAGKLEILLRILLEAGLEPDSALFVGDAVNDLLAARAAGIPFVGRVPEGAAIPFPPDEAVLVVHDLAELDRRWAELG